jgi:hypothetical protein|tara:strand:+ start:367 stop:609 length:243 start_codon:yes stop_codon:yes gene_type:complete
MQNDTKKPPKTPEERFMEVAPMRVTRVINAINSLSKCSSRNYKYTDQQVNKMLRAIKLELRIAEDKFKNHGKNGSTKFKF